MTDPAAPVPPEGPDAPRRSSRAAGRRAAPPGRRRRRVPWGRGARPGPASRTTVAAVTSALLVAAVVVGGVQLQAARERAAEAERSAQALSLAVDAAEREGEFLADRDRAATRDAARQAAGDAQAAREAAAAQAEAARVAQEQAAAQAAAQAEADRLAAERAAQEAAEDAAAAERAPAQAPTAPGIAGWVDGRPVDAQGDVLWVTSVPTADGDGSNGHMPMSGMCQVPWGTDRLGFAQYLRCDAADALTALNDAFRAQFGASIDMDLTYRSYAGQVAMKAELGGLAAAPGTSSHGLGTALDVQEWPDVYGFGTARYDWLVANGPTYGWYAPARVRQGQPYAEYWHFEYGPGRTS